MKKYIELNSETIEYTLKVNSRAKRINVRIKHGGEVIATIPRSIHQGLVEDFMKRKSEWIIRTINVFTSLKKQITKKDDRLQFLELKEEARRLVHSRIEHYNAFYQFTYHKVAIRNQKTRWGSCSRKGNLNFSYKLVLLPPHLADYIVIHELCHLKEFNHSPKFWDLVAKTLPNHKELRKELLKSSHHL